jgi:Na+/H+ antiporter NhaA
LGPWSASASVRFIVNDVLMAVFFFVIGLEIRGGSARRGWGIPMATDIV